MNTLQDQWSTYASQALSIGTPEAQMIDTRRAFYAGAQAMLGLQNKALDMPCSEEAQVQMLEGWYQELNQFVEDLLAGRA